jgi:Uncharacterised nucleotidyltransferase
MSALMATSAPEFSERSAKANWFAHLAANRVLRTVVSALSAHSIPVLPVKGVITAHLLYRDIASRPIRDVDIRLRRSDFGRAVRLAQTRGWHAKHVVLLGQDLWKVDGLEVDVKCALGPPGLCALSVDDVVRRAELRVEPFGFAHLECELNDHALILVLNVFKDGLRTAPWAVEDLRRIVCHERFDAPTLVERANAGRVASALWIVANWLAETQGAPGWRAVVERIGRHPPSTRAAGTYALWQRFGSSRRVGHFIVPSVNDDAWRSVLGLGCATIGLARGYGLRAADALAPRERHR